MIVEHLIKKYDTNNPFAIADNLNIIVIHSEMKNVLGFFNRYRRSKFIHLNDNMPESLKNFVCAHELGHAIQHPDMNTPFLKRHTLFSTDRIEREANTFAVELLLTDELLHEYEGYGISTIARTTGIPDKLIELKKIIQFSK